MSTMVGAPRTTACRRADQDREAHGTAALDNGTLLPMSIARRTWQRDQGCPFATRGRLGVRPRGPTGRDGYEVDAMIGAPVYPLANRTCPHWPNPASRPAAGFVDAEDVQRHPARWRPGVCGPAEPVLASAVLDHDHAKTIVSEDTVQPSVGQINGCEQSGAGHTASVQLVQHLSGRTPARGPAGETHGPSPSTIASIRPRWHQTRRWLALRLLRRLRRAGIQSDGAEGEAYVLQHRGGRENLLGNGRPRLPIARNSSRRN